MSDVSRETPHAPLELAGIPGLVQYVDILATAGVERGLLGPREVPRLWTRHVANCAVVALRRDLVPEGSSVIDVGSGAGLPGLVWALVRPDLRVVTLEPLLRRSNFLSETVAALDLQDRVAVVRGRAEDYRGEPADIVTARAVAALGPLAELTLPLARVRVLAFKGETAQAELNQAQAAILAAGGRDPQVLVIDGPGLDRPTIVVGIERDSGASRPRRGRGGRV